MYCDVSVGGGVWVVVCVVCECQTRASDWQVTRPFPESFSVDRTGKESSATHSHTPHTTNPTLLLPTLCDH